MGAIKAQARVNKITGRNKAVKYVNVSRGARPIARLRILSDSKMCFKFSLDLSHVPIVHTKNMKKTKIKR